jgi:hypothetical protein
LQFCTVLCLVLSGNADPYQEHVRPFLAKHCLKCHRGDAPKGELRLDQLAEIRDDTSREQWESVLERLESGKMPPKTQPRPAEDETRTVLDAIRQQIQSAEEARRQTEGRVVLRRLNRTEYQNTICDLLGIQVKLKDQLPADGSADGFDNAGAALHTSSFLMEKYLEAAETALDLAIANRPQPKLISMHIKPEECRQIKRASENVFRREEAFVVCFSSSPWQSVDFGAFYPSDPGLYRFRISASAYQSQGKPVTYRVTTGNRQLSGKDGLVGYFDAPADKPTVVEFVHFMEPRTSLTILPYGLATAQAVNKVGADAFEGPGLALHWMEVEGPLYDAWPPESHRRIFGDLPQKPAPVYRQSNRVEVVSDQPFVDADRILRPFIRRAFRRTVTDDDVAPFTAIVRTKLDQNYSFEQAMRAAFKGVLISPEFLFLRESPGKLDDFALASRLSYFLWSTMPDEELLELAARGELLKEGESGREGEGEKSNISVAPSPTPPLAHSSSLRAQVERMLKHPKAAAFTENFVGQWLALREIDATEPSHLLYPDFDHMLKVSMIREAELFFDEVLRENLSLTNFVASDFSMLNGRLAKHYNIPGVNGWEFSKVTLPPESHRGGVLTMAGVLKVTANGTTTSPVFRGTWILDRILGTPAPPPPDDVPAIDPDVRGATTVREQLAKHRADAACASCHAMIDPPGFALESFDCIGGWREKYRVTGNGEPVTINGQRMLYRLGKTVDPSDVMPSGQPFANIDDFKQILLADKDQLARSVATKLITYATGRAPDAADRPQIDAIVARISEQDYGLRSLVHEIVQSELFRNK